MILTELLKVALSKTRSAPEERRRIKETLINIEIGKIYW